MHHQWRHLFLCKVQLFEQMQSLDNALLKKLKKKLDKRAHKSTEESLLKRDGSVWCKYLKTAQCTVNAFKVAQLMGQIFVCSLKSISLLSFTDPFDVFQLIVFLFYINPHSLVSLSPFTFTLMMLTPLHRYRSCSRFRLCSDFFM